MARPKKESVDDTEDKVPKKRLTDKEKIFEALKESNPYTKFLSEKIVSDDDWIDTGSMPLNAIISGSLYKGIPKGKLVQFVGPSGVFKSGFILQILKNAQDMGMTVVLFDSEDGVAMDAAIAFGLDVEQLIYVSALTIEQTKNDIYTTLSKIHECKQNGNYIIAIDSLATLLAELEQKRADKGSGASDMGSIPRAMKSLLRMCTGMASATNTPIIATNWIYEDPSEMYPSLEKHINGGKGAVYIPTVTVQLGKSLVKDDDIKHADTKLAAGQKSFSGIQINALTVKNRLIKQFLEVKMYLSMSYGLSRYYGLIDLAVSMGVIEPRGSVYYDWQGNKLGYAKNWSKNKDVWDKHILPELEPRLMKEWSYSNLKNTPPDEMGLMDDEEEEGDMVLSVDIPSPSALDALKKLKTKVTSKLDEMEAEESLEVYPSPD